jgi:hypothetical protein
MRLILPTITSRRIIFSQRYYNLAYIYGSNGQVNGSVSVAEGSGLSTSGGGYVKYGSYGASCVSYLPYWSVYIKAIIPAAGSARTLFTCGESGSDKFELGIDSSNNMQLIGTSTVTSDDALTEGEHNLIYIYDGTNVEFWVDGVRIGTEVVTLGSGISISIWRQLY